MLAAAVVLIGVNTLIINVVVLSLLLRLKRKDLL